MSEIFEDLEVDNENGSYFLSGIVDSKQIRKADLSLSDKHNFSFGALQALRVKLSRENIVKFGVITGEEAIPIEDTKGDVKISLVRLAELEKKIKGDRRIGYIHISTIQFILKSTLVKGIDMPVKLQIRDDRLIREDESIIAIGEGNLREEKLKFNVNLQIGLSLKDRNLDRSITVGYEILRKELMKKGNHPFSITYRFNYALTNSHHSLTFVNKDKIEIDDLFGPLLKLESPKRFTKQESSRIIREEKEENPTRIKKIEPPVSLRAPSTIDSLERIEKTISKIAQQI